MGEIRLGKIHLRWCDTCNVPILEQSSCGICGGKTREVKITPPGDARPAFEFDIDRIRMLIDSQFGTKTGEAIVPPGHIVLLNKAPDIDRMDEVIVDGAVVGAVRFGLTTGERFILRPAGATIIARRAERGWVEIDKGAVNAIRSESASTLAVGVISCDSGILPGSEVVVRDSAKEAVSVGISKMSSSEMLAHKRGTAVKTRWVVANNDTSRPSKSASWEEVIAANREVMERRVREAKEFVGRVVRENNLPVAVSYSGGKDSLATLNLVLDAGIKPKLLFIDTGLEFEETKRNVREVAEEYGLDLVTESAGDAFWKNLEHFGPPARDFRWCCKTCKLGPATRIIQRNFPDGVLSFIGQRAYESEKRAAKGKVWRNPWTPGQLAASPIQKWTALHIWLYLFSKRANVNTLYSEGLERIGCFMCPATDLAELRRVKSMGREYARWQAYLDDYSDRMDMAEAWSEYDIWRWKRIPDSVVEELRLAGITLDRDKDNRDTAIPLEFRTTSGYNPCVEGLSMEGIFNKPLDMGRVSRLLNIVGEVVSSPDGSIAEVDKITVFAEGPVMVKAKNEQELKEKASKIREVVFRAMDCAGCGICVARCKTGALYLDGVVTLNEELCTHCGSCLGPCPVVRFRDDDLDI